MQQHFVALASDCDDPEEAVGELTLAMPDAMTLPFVIFTDAEGRFLGGTEGSQSASGFRAILLQTIEAANARR